MTSILQIDIRRETSKAPRILSEVHAALSENKMKHSIDDYLRVLMLFTS